MPGVLAPGLVGLRIGKVLPLAHAPGRQGLPGMDVVEVAPRVHLPNRITAGWLVGNAVAAPQAPGDGWAPGAGRSPGASPVPCGPSRFLVRNGT